MTEIDRNTSEMMKNTLKNGVGEDTRNKLKKIGNVFQVIVRWAYIRLQRKSDIATVYIPTGHQKKRKRMLKPREF